MISIITPSYQQGSFIERTIQSVITQSPDEYWVIDGGSQDETLSILNRYKTQLNFISESDQGQAHAVNKGLQRVTGDIIGWLNSDDIYYSDTLSFIKQFFATHPEIDVVYGKAHHIDEHDHILSSYPTCAFNKKELLQRCFLSQPAVFFRRCVIERCGLLDENLHFCMDYEYWLRLMQRGVTFSYIEKYFAGSRVHQHTKTKTQPIKMHQEAMHMVKNKCGFLPRRWYFSYARVCCGKHPLCFLLTSLKTAITWNGFVHGFFSYCLGLLLLPKMWWAVRRVI